jgi:hypothetical protein
MKIIADLVYNENSNIDPTQVMLRALEKVDDCLVAHFEFGELVETLPNEWAVQEWIQYQEAKARRSIEAAAGSMMSPPPHPSS